MHFECRFVNPINSTATVAYTGYLNQLDFVQVEKMGDQNKGHINDDWFEGRMIP